jgi:predicted NACHT family NTPase
VFVLSPDSARSEICAWEIEEAARLSKRLIPVLCRPLEAGQRAPGALNALNLIYFYAEPDKPGSGFGSGLRDLVAALRLDFAWVREHSRVAERAGRWDSEGRPPDRLVRGSELEAWLAWRRARPSDAPEITAVQHAFLDDSELAERKRNSSARWALIRLGAVSALGVALMGILAAIALNLAWFSANNLGIQFADLSDQAFKNSDFDRAMRYGLAGVRTGDGELIGPDYAGAEFRLTEAHWRFAFKRTLRGHKGAVLFSKFSPDGKTIVTASDDTTAKIWDAKTGQMRATLEGHTGAVVSAQFSPDGKTVLTASDENTAKIWDVTTGAERATLKGHTKGVLSAQFSPDGKTVLTASSDNTAKLWDAATGTERATLRGHTGPFYDAQFSPDGKSIVTASWDNTAKIWDVSLLAKPRAERIALACARLKELGLAPFTGAEMAREIVKATRRPDQRDPCNREGLLSASWWRTALGLAPAQ